MKRPFYACYDMVIIVLTVFLGSLSCHGDTALNHRDSLLLGAHLPFPLNSFFLFFPGGGGFKKFQEVVKMQLDHEMQLVMRQKGTGG